MCKRRLNNCMHIVSFLLFHDGRSMVCCPQEPDRSISFKMRLLSIQFVINLTLYLGRKYLSQILSHFFCFIEGPNTAPNTGSERHWMCRPLLEKLNIACLKESYENWNSDTSIIWPLFYISVKTVYNRFMKKKRICQKEGARNKASSKGL